MNHPKSYYREKIQTTRSAWKKLKKQATTIAAIRGAIFLGTAILIYLFSAQFSTYWMLLIPIIAVFLWLVKKYQNVKKEIEFHENIIEINQTELDVMKGDMSKLEDGAQYNTADHPFCHDIDLFGQGSFFHFINRTTTQEGEARLAHVLASNDIDNIDDKQEEIQELSEKVAFRQQMAAHSMMVATQQDSKKMIQWFQDHPKETSPIIQYGVYIFSAISIGLIVAGSLEVISSNIVLYWFLFGLALVVKNLKKTNKTAFKSSEYADTISQYSLLIHHIENEKFSSARLVEVQNNIRTEEQSASEILSKLGRIINALNNRNSILVSAILNGFFLYDYYWISQLKIWMKQYTNQIEQWFEAVYHIDAVNSLAGYAFNHPTYTYPTLVDTASIIKATALGHPQIPDVQRVNNDFTIDQEQFIIITGANMAGKSTFLRTVALHIVLSNSGLPATAKSFAYRPIKLISSMRTSDSLKDQESYFFSELKRLKYIIDQIETDEYFIILDEILKGTNSKDKEEGSKKFVKKLISTKATGIIATHDLSLCTLADEHPEVINRYFDAEIIDDELYFDYTFKDGVCQNMNASFLLKKMNIV